MALPHAIIRLLFFFFISPDARHVVLYLLTISASQHWLFYLAFAYLRHTDVNCWRVKLLQTRKGVKKIKQATFIKASSEEISMYRSSPAGGAINTSTISMLPCTIMFFY